jgi:glycosyltransferase involved in cell wall biosynthesis
MTPLRLGQRRDRANGAAEFALLQTTVPAYRDAFVRHLLAESPTSVVWAGDDYFDPSIRLSSYVASRCGRLGNRFLLGRRLAWQQGAFSAARRPAVVVLELNPRILSNWLILLYRRLLRRRTIVWGHAWPRRGPGAKTFLLRMSLLRLADAALVYTERDQRELVARVGTPVFVAPNAVVTSGEWASTEGGNPANVVQVGRLVASKKPALALDAWLSICDELNPSAKLIFVGDGPARLGLESTAARHKHGSRVEFMGEVTSRKTLSRIYADALVSLSPGYAGLSLTDSLGYGVPMLIADHEPHAPEIALASRANSRFFRADDPASLAEEIVLFFRDRELWVSRRHEVAVEVRGTYSIEAMVRGFLAAVRGGSIPPGLQ